MKWITVIMIGILIKVNMQKISQNGIKSLVLLLIKEMALWLSKCAGYMRFKGASTSAKLVFSLHHSGKPSKVLKRND